MGSPASASCLTPRMLGLSAGRGHLPRSRDWAKAGGQGPGCSRPRTILSTRQPLGLERSRYLHLFAFTGRVQVILHQDFPTQKDGLCQTERDFLSCPSQESCMPRPAPSSRHLAFSRYSKEQILPQTQFLFVRVIFLWQ